MPLQTLAGIALKKQFLSLVLPVTDIFCHPSGYIVSGKQNNTMKQELVNLFRKAAASGRLPEVLASNSTFNIEFPTLGGEVFWETSRSHGWKLQVNTISGWWRILDANDVRIARGTTEEQLEALLNDRPTSIFGNYLDSGCRFSKIQAINHSGRTVVLIHGWGVRAISMQKLAQALARKGYDAYNYDYPTSKHRLDEHCRTFLAKFRELLEELPTEESLHILTHSMGGLVLRGAMSGMTETECRRIVSIVMLGPPNRGSILAYLGKLPGISEISESLKDMTPDDDSFVSNIPASAYLPPVGIIAGRYDGKVALDNTRLPAPLPYKRIVVDCTHPGLRNPSNVIKPVLEFFSCQSFQTENIP